LNEKELTIAIRQKLLEEARQNLTELESNQDELNRSLEEKEQAIAEREQLLAEARSETERIAVEKDEAEKQAASAQAERDSIAEKQVAVVAEARELSATINASDEELRRKSAELARLESELALRSEKLDAAERRRAESEAENQRLANEVRISEKEKELLTSNLVTATETIEVEREEKKQLRRQNETLSEGVNRLADASTEMTKEVKSLRPMTSNEIFGEVSNNSVSIEFQGSRSGLFGSNSFTESVESVITRVNGRPFVWIHLSKTPFSDSDRRKFLNEMEAFLEAGGKRFRIPQLGILRQNPNLLFLPLTEEIVSQLGIRVFSTTETPFRFEDLVVIDLPASRYGETSFRINPETPDSIEVDSRIFSSLFGEFSPAAGDFAFTRTGDFLGIVTRSGSAWMAGTVGVAGKIDFGENFSRAQLSPLP